LDTHQDNLLKLVLKISTLFTATWKILSIVTGELIEQVLKPGDARTVLERLEREGIDGYGYEVQNELRKRGHGGIIMINPGL
jgi:hypothetical protein